MVRFRPKGRCFPTIVSFLLSSLLFLSSAAGHCAGHFYNVNAAEGIIGAISGNFTLWDLATTALGAAGFMIVNEDIQNTAATHLGGNEYTLDYLVQEGLIEVNEQPSYSWDWSGLKNLMSDWQNYKDSNMMYKINQAAAAYSPDLEDLWIDVFKQFVEVGKIGVDKIGSGINSTISDLSGWIGQAFGANVETGMPVDINTVLDGMTINAAFWFNNSPSANGRCLSFNPQNVKVFAGRNGSVLYLICANRGTGVEQLRYKNFTGSIDETIDLRGHTSDSPGYLATSADQFVNPINISQYNSLDAAYVAVGEWYNSSGSVVIQSPDILTTDGAAVYPSEGTWAPSPYLGGLDWPDAWLQPVPAGAWSPAIDDLLDAPALPAPGEAGDVFGGVFDPYMEDSPAIDIPGDDVVPVPTVAPRPTTAAGEGTMDVPYAVVPADPVPAMEDGAGQLPNIGEFFPFCIPGDFVYITKLLWSEDNVRTAPHIYLPLRIPSLNFSYDIDIDFTPFDQSAELLRTLVLISFCIALAILTKNLIWS